MIRWFLLQNRAGRTRLAKYYVPMDDAQKRKNEYEVFRTLSGRESKWSNVAEVWTTDFLHVAAMAIRISCCSALAVLEHHLKIS